MGKEALSPDFDEKNRRRHALINKKYPGKVNGEIAGLSKEEDAELEELLKWTGVEINRAFPLPIDKLEAIQAQLRAKGLLKD